MMNKIIFMEKGKGKVKVNDLTEVQILKVLSFSIQLLKEKSIPEYVTQEELVKEVKRSIAYYKSLEDRIKKLEGCNECVTKK